MACKCHPNSPFLWRKNPRDSIFMADHTYRAKGVEGKSEAMLAFKNFGVYSRAVAAKAKPNKHQLPKGKL
jgi:hypothetical protein